MSTTERLLTLTDRAVFKLQEIIAREKKQASSVRLALVRTHCMGGRGYENKIAFDDSPAEDDELLEHNGIKVCVDKASAKYLKGAELDYVDTLESAGFKVNNPNVKSRCPCGHHDIFE